MNFKQSLEALAPAVKGKGAGAAVRLALAAALAAYVALLFTAPSAEAPIAPQSIIAQGERGYAAPAPKLIGLGINARPDDSEHPTRSRVILLEDGKPLGPSHSIHADIADVGRGRFSHWGDAIIFSSSDGADPRTSGRIYTARAPFAMPGWLHFLAAAAAISLAVMLRAGQMVARGWRAVDRVDRLFAGAGGVAAVLISLAAFSPRVERDVGPADILPFEGFAYKTSAPALAGGFPGSLYRINSDSVSEPRRSSLSVFELGVKLGPGHSAHDKIASEGAGRFSHWGGIVDFSASDGSDPRKNNRPYRVVARASLSPWIAAALGVAALAMAARALQLVSRGEGGLARVRRILDVAFIAISAGAGAIVVADVWSVSGFFPLIYNDSPSYLYSPLQRGYLMKALLELAVATPFGARAIVVMNVALFLAAAVKLGISIGKVCGFLGAGALAAALILIQPSLIEMLPAMLSEPMFLGFIMLHLAFALDWLRAERPRDIALSALMAGLAILVRPAGYGLAAGFLLLLLAARNSSMRRVVLAGATLAVTLFCGALPNYFNYGVFSTQAIGGFAMLGHVIQLADGTERYRDPEIAAAVLAAAKGHSTVGNAPWPLAHARKSAEEYNRILFNDAVAPTAEIVAARRDVTPTPKMGETMPQDLLAEIDADLSDMATAIVRRHPVPYAGHAAANLCFAWWNLFALTPSIGENASAFGLQSRAKVSASPTLQRAFRTAVYPSEKALARWRKAEGVTFLSERIYDPLRPTLHAMLPIVALLTATGAIGLVLRLFQRRSSNLLWLCFAYISTQLWAYFGLVALAQPAVPRYAAIGTIFMFPALALFASSAVATLAGGRSQAGAAAAPASP